MDKNSFMLAILHDPSLTASERDRVITLIAQELEKDIILQTKEIVQQEINKRINKTTTVKEKTYSSDKVWIHNPKEVNCFLKKFTTDPTLKFALHSWDEGDFIGGYDNFIKKITDCLNEDITYKELYFYNIALRYTLWNFLQNDGSSTAFSIPRESLQIGLRHPAGYIKKWMDSHPGKKMGEMPILEFPEQYRPIGKFNGHHLGNLSDVIDYFKHIIEFRDDDFEALLHTTFNNSDYNSHIDDSVKGLSFYAYTSVVHSYLSSISNNIRERITNGASKTVNIFVDKATNESFELHILHEGSYSKRKIDDEKLLSTGSIASWRSWKSKSYNSLLSICDYSIVSLFYSKDNTLKAYKIEYLYAGLCGKPEDIANLPTARVIEVEEAKGFEYILKFYI